MSDSTQNSEKSEIPESKIEHFMEKYGFGLMICAIGVVVAFVFRDYIIQRKLYLFSDNGQDSLVVFYPKWLEVSRYLREWGLPSWSFQTGMGQDIFPGNVNDPFSLLLYLSGDYLARSIIYVELIKFFTVGILFYFYLRTIGLQKYASATGGLMMAFSGYMIVGSSGWYGHSSLVVYGVFWLLSFEQLYVKRNIFLFPLAVVLLSASSIFYVYIFTVFLVIYAMIRYFGDHSYTTDDIPPATISPIQEDAGENAINNPIKSGAGVIKAPTGIYGFVVLMLKLAGLGALGLAMNAIFIINPLITMLGSPRVGGDASYANKLLSHPVFSLADPLEYLTAASRLFSVDILGTAEKFFLGDKLIQSYHGWGNHFEAPLFYCTLPALLLLPQVFLFINKRRKIALSIFFALLGVVLIFPYFRYALYLFSGNYYKGGLNFFIPASILWCAMWAMNEIEIQARISIKLLTATLAGLLAMLFYLSFLSPISNRINENIAFEAATLLILYAVNLFLLTKPNSRVVGKISFFILLVLELLIFSNVTINQRNAMTIKDFTTKHGYNDYTKEAVEYIKSIDKNFYRIQKEYVGKPAVYINMNDSQIQDFYGTPSYNSFNQKYYIAFLAGADLLDPTKEWQTRCSRGVSGCPVMQSFASVKYSLEKSPRSKFAKFGYKFKHKIGDISIYENPYALPFGFTCDKYLTESEYKNLDSRQKAFAMLKVFTVPDSSAGKMKGIRRFDIKGIPKRYTFREYAADIAVLRKHHLKITSFSPKRITGTIDMPSERMMIFTTPYDKGWQATVDGVKTPIHIVDYGLIGVSIPKGNHTMELRFRPPYFLTGLIISICAMCIFIGAILLRFFRKKSENFQFELLKK